MNKELTPLCNCSWCEHCLVVNDCEFYCRLLNFEKVSTEKVCDSFEDYTGVNNEK